MNQPGNVYIIAGDRMYGKTVALECLVDTYHNYGADVLYLTPRHPERDDYWTLIITEKDVPLTAPKVNAALDEAVRRSQPLVLHDRGIHPEEVGGAMDAIAHALMTRGRLTFLAIDEAHFYAPSKRSSGGSQMSPRLTMLSKAGRHYPGGGVHIAYATQVPVELETRIVQAGNVFLLFHLEHQLNRKWVAERAPVNILDKRNREWPADEAVSRLEVGEYLLIDVDNGYRTVERCPLKVGLTR